MLAFGQCPVAGRVGIKKTVIYTRKKGDFRFFYDFARAGPVVWTVIWKLLGPVFKPSPPLGGQMHGPSPNSNFGDRLPSPLSLRAHDPDTTKQRIG